MTRFRTLAACAALSLPLAACGGGGDSVNPPITLNGVSYDTSGTAPRLRETEGGDGTSVIFVDDGVREILARRIGGSGSEAIYQSDDGVILRLTAVPGFESTRFISMEEDGAPFAEGIIGRFTGETRMAAATGTATYLGAGRGVATVRVEDASGPLFDLEGAETVTSVVVDFGTPGNVTATLDFSRTASAVFEPIDTVEITGMTISGNRFSGGTLEASKGGVPVPDYSASAGQLASSGVFSGWNDTTGNVRGGNLPAEVGGAFLAEAEAGRMTGFYLAD